MSEYVRLKIDGRVVEAPVGSSVMDACALADVYVPRLCAYPGLEPVGDCGLCFVRVSAAGAPAEARRACSVEVLPGMIVDTSDEEARGFRTASMKTILGDHPHVCLTCPQRDGCSRDECMYGNEPEARCCGEFGRCEIAMVAAYVGALETAPTYAFRSLGVSVDHNIRRDLDLCIGCGRCVAACDTLEEAGRALRLVETISLVGTMSGGSPSSATAARSSTGDVAATSTCRGVASFDDTGPWKPQSYLGRHVAMPKERGLRSSGCTFCGACVLVCPTGALTAEGAKGSAWLATRRERTTVNPAILPPEERLAFTPAAVASVPPGEGVLRLYSATGEVLQISGVLDMRSALEEALSGPLAAEAVAFVYDAEHMYTQREAELLAHHLQAHGSMPRGNDILGDLLGDEEDDLF